MDANDKSATTSRKALTTVAILPLGQVDEAELEFVADVLRNFFCFQIKRLPVARIPNNYRHLKRGRYNADQLLNFTLSRKPKNVGFIVGVFNRGLFVKNTGIVHGYAFLTKRAMVYSTNDLFDECLDIKIKQRRSLWLILHEMGHVLGYNHCLDSSCAMNSTTLIKDLDHFTPQYCSECLNKIYLKITEIFFPTKQGP